MRRLSRGVGGMGMSTEVARMDFYTIQDVGENRTYFMGSCPGANRMGSTRAYNALCVAFAPAIVADRARTMVEMCEAQHPSPGERQ